MHDDVGVAVGMAVNLQNAVARSVELVHRAAAQAEKAASVVATAKAAIVCHRQVRAMCEAASFRRCTTWRRWRAAEPSGEETAIGKGTTMWIKDNSYTCDRRFPGPGNIAHPTRSQIG